MQNEFLWEIIKNLQHDYSELLVTGVIIYKYLNKQTKKRSQYFATVFSSVCCVIWIIILL